jgi:hypothetical protein
MIEFGALYADAFGGSLQENTGELVQGALAGNLQQLVKFGLLTAQQAEFGQGFNFNTVQGKELVLNKLAKTRIKLERLKEKSLKTQGTQWRALMANVEDFGKMIGEFLNPIFGEFLSLVNDVFEAFLESPTAKAVAKILTVSLEAC